MRSHALVVIALLSAFMAMALLTGLTSPNRATGVILPTPPPAGVALVVTTATDEYTPDSGTCSLREAIIAANGNTHVDTGCDANGSTGPDGIFFNIGPGGVQTITLSTPLPPITGSVSIDATGQPAGADNCGVGKMPCIRLDGTNAGTGAVGLNVSASGVSLRGLAIIRFSNAVDVVSGSNIAITGNYIGTADGIAAAPNKYEGIRVESGVSAVRIGGTTAADRNVISGNNNDPFPGGLGIVFVGDNSVIEGNYIGTTAAGDAALANAYGGIDMAGSNNTIGGTDAGAANVISGNGGAGLQLDTLTNVYGNLIGTDASGVQAIQNTTGVLLIGPNIVLGGIAAGQRNVISGNYEGVKVFLVSGSQIVGNYIGLNASGSGAIGNAFGVEFLYSSGSHENDTTISANVISGNSTGVNLANGQYADAESNGTILTDNIIGLNAAGTAAVPNGEGVVLNSNGGGHIQNTAIGQSGHPNVISGNGGSGVVLRGANTQSTSVIHNYIGTNQNLDSGLGNAVDGLLIQASSHNMIGGSGGTHGNVIMHNGGDGVLIDDLSMGAYADTISENSIDSNGGLGIRLIGQANNYQAAPVLDSATAGSTHVTGTLTSANSTQYTIEFFRSPACDGSGAGEGRTFLGSTQVVTSASGVAQIDATLSAGTPAGQRVTATATSPDGDTSQFSNCVKMAGPTPTPSPTPSPTPTHSPTPTPIHHPTPTPSGGAVLRGDANCDGKVDTSDALADLSAAVGVPPGAPCADRADADCDGDVDANDALRILLYAAGTPMTQPSGCSEIGKPV